MDDLVKRARNRLNDAPMETEHLIDDLADRIELDAKRIAELEHERDEWHQRAYDRCEEAEKWFRKRGEEIEAREAAEARVKVLEDALRRLIARDQWEAPFSKAKQDGAVAAIARAALEGEKK